MSDARQSPPVPEAARTDDEFYYATGDSVLHTHDGCTELDSARSVNTCPRSHPPAKRVCSRCGDGREVEASIYHPGNTAARARRLLARAGKVIDECLAEDPLLSQGVAMSISLNAGLCEIWAEAQAIEAEKVEDLRWGIIRARAETHNTAVAADLREVEQLLLCAESLLGDTR